MSSEYESDYLNVCVEGCLHGELDAVYASVAEAEAKGAPKVDLLIICGDFQSVRAGADLDSLEVPEKYKQLGDFHKYASGECAAPVLTVFIGGNHEASNVLKSLYYGGWVAPNIYFLGFAGVVTMCGVRIAGCSGIHNTRDYTRGHYEEPPYDRESKRSIYHTRELEVYRLKQLARRSVDVMLTHDWPVGVWQHGDRERLLRQKPFLREDMDSGRLGSRPYADLLSHMRPDYWFAAHLHCKFAALVVHPPDHSAGAGQPPPPLCGDAGAPVTRFLSLDKVIPGRDFLQFMQIPCDQPTSRVLHYDAEWLGVLTATHTLLSTNRQKVYMPHGSTAVSPGDVQAAAARFTRRNGSLAIPTVTAVETSALHVDTNVQTDVFLGTLGLPHIWTRPMHGSAGGAGGAGSGGSSSSTAAAAVATATKDPNELDLDFGEDEEEDLDYCDEGGEAAAVAVAPAGAAGNDTNELDIDDM